MQKGHGISGRLTATPELEYSRAGRPYCSFCIVTPEEELLSCVAFDTTAQELCRKAGADMSIKVAGRTTSDGSYAISAFLIPKVGEATRASNYIPKPPEPMFVDPLMDKLGADYVTARMRGWVRNTGSMTDPSRKRGSDGLARACTTFNVASFKELIAELQREAEEPWV